MEGKPKQKPAQNSKPNGKGKARKPSLGWARRLALISTLLLVGLLLLSATLIYQHARWLPEALNHTLLSRSLAGLPAASLQLQQLRFSLITPPHETFNLRQLRQDNLRLDTLILTGPANSQLSAQGVHWLQTGHLTLESLHLVLPDRPLSSAMPQKNKDAAVITSDQGFSWPVTDQYQAEYQILNRQIAPLLTQLEQFSTDTGLQQIQIKQLTLQGLPLTSALSLQRTDAGIWQLTLTSQAVQHTKTSNTEEANTPLLTLGFSGKISGDAYQLSLNLQQGERLQALITASQQNASLPEWLRLNQALEALQQAQKSPWLQIPALKGHAALKLTPTQAQLELELPPMVLQPLPGCPLALPQQQLRLHYQTAADGQAQQLQLHLPDTYTLPLAGDCLAGLNALATLTSSASGLMVKGIDAASLNQGGVLELMTGGILYLQRQHEHEQGRLSANSLKLNWRPNAPQAPTLTLALPQLQLTPQRLQAKLAMALQAELYPQPLFAAQSRQLEAEFQGTLDLQRHDAKLKPPHSTVLKQLSLTLEQSQLRLKPAPNDSAVLWAPQQLELPLAAHQGGWQLSYKQQQWQLAHQGQGELLLRHPQLKQNLRLPYSTELTTTLPDTRLSASALTKEQQANSLSRQLSGLQLRLKLQLEERQPLVDSRAETATPLLPQLALAVTLTPEQLTTTLNTQLEIARLPQWITLPGKSLISDGHLQSDLQLALPAPILLSLLAGNLENGAHLENSTSEAQTLDPLASQLAIQFRGQLADLAGQAQGYEFSGVTLPFHLNLQQRRWQLAPTKIRADRFFAGVELKQLALGLNATGALAPTELPLQFELNHFKADTLGGRITLSKVNYPFQGQSTADLVLHGLDLSELIALGEKQIKITGRLNGTLPLQIRDQGVAIRQGSVFSREGEIVLRDNPAWQAMLQQQSALAGQLRHLNYLHYDLLQGDIEMTENGQLTAALRISGENRAESQPVNLNFTSEQNILTLLKALRLSDQIDKSLSESAQRTFQ